MRTWHLLEQWQIVSAIGWNLGRDGHYGLFIGRESQKRRDALKASAKQWTVVVALGVMLGWAPTLAGQVSSLQAGGRSSSTGVSTQGTSSSVARLMRGGENTTAQKASAYRTALHNARKALAGGNLDQARTFVAQAKSMTVDRSHSDSPVKVEKMIARHNKMRDLYKNKDNSYNQKTAEFLVDQAWELTSYGDWQSAKFLADNAVQFSADFSSSAVKPAAVFKRISELQAGSGDLKSRAMSLMAKMQLAMDQNRLREAGEFSRQLRGMNLADSMFKAGEPRPWKMDLELQSKLASSSVSPAGFQTGRDQSRVVPASATGRQDERLSPIACYLEGVRAIERNDRASALKHFEKAWAGKEKLAPEVQASLNRHLSAVRGQGIGSGVSAIPASATLGRTQDRPTGVLGGNDQIIIQKLRSHVIRTRANADRLRKEDKVVEAMAELKKLRTVIEGSDANPVPKSGLIRMVDREIKDLDGYMQTHRMEIDNRLRNDAVREDIAQMRTNRYNNEHKLKNMIDNFNRMYDEKRFAEAEVVARQAAEINDREPAVVTMLQKVKVARRDHERNIADDLKERGIYNELTIAETSARPIIGDLELGNGWPELSARRRSSAEARNISNPADHEIWKRLEAEQVMTNFDGTSISDVVDILGKQAGLNIQLDPKGLEEANIDSSSPVNMKMNQAISLESVLRELAKQKGLYLTVENQFVKLTSKSGSMKLIQNPTYVGDLVTPIPNFAATSPVQMMVGGGIVQGSGSYANLTPGLGTNLGALAPSQAAAGGINPLALAQYAPGNPDYANLIPKNIGAPNLRDSSSKLGGGSQADFESLIQLIQNTISPDIWEEEGGSGSTITQYANTNSLVIRAPQSVHDEIQTLLKRLRELQDVQIVIETRFITLQDNFFERIGVDFDFQIDDNSGFNQNTLANLDDSPPSVVVGRNADGGLPADLDIPFSQDSFTSAVPQFGGFDVGTAANFGFAILSDIEVFFLLQAAKGDTRSNVMLAPKITLFNGQQGNIQDTVNQNFVTSVTPVVGSFAAAQAPVITTLAEGTMLNVTAVTDNDRRYVRMTLVPTFTQIRGVNTFTFSGRTEVDSGTNVFDPTNGVFQNNSTQTTEGVSVQLPQFAITQISATVAVPDGGTILLGGVKRLNEARTERGVPFLSNIPYVSRLFKNTGIGRETSSLMMMVTPRVIIKDEQEQLQVNGGN